MVWLLRGPLQEQGRQPLPTPAWLRSSGKRMAWMLMGTALHARVQKASGLPLKARRGTAMILPQVQLGQQGPGSSRRMGQRLWEGRQRVRQGA
jgi:hypothetical protein